MYRYNRNRFSTSRSRYPVTTSFRYGTGRGSTTTSRALGSARASKNATKLNYFNCTVNGNFMFSRTENAYYTNVIAFYPAVGGVYPQTGLINDTQNGNIYGGIVNDRTFRLMCAQYDEFKIVSMRVKINLPPPNNQAITLCTITDRSASREEVEMDQSAMTDINSDVPSFREVCESQGSLKTILNSNRIYPITRSIYARDLQEKTSYTDCTITYDTDAGETPLGNLTFAQFPTFCPAIYFCVKLTDTSGVPLTFSGTYSVEYNCIFRNPKSDLQTFIIKEDPDYVNPASRSVEEDTRMKQLHGITTITSGDPYIPDMELKNGQETNISWLKRYKARFALNQSKVFKPELLRFTF